MKKKRQKKKKKDTKEKQKKKNNTHTYTDAKKAKCVLLLIIKLEWGMNNFRKCLRKGEKQTVIYHSSIDTDGIARKDFDSAVLTVILLQLFLILSVISSLSLPPRSHTTFHRTHNPSISLSLFLPPSLSLSLFFSVEHVHILCSTSIF